MHLQTVLDVLEQIAPLRYAEPWDNVGLLLGDANHSLHGVLLAIDCTEEVLHEAHEAGCNLVVSYHPPLFKGVTKLTPPHPAYEAVRRGIAVYSPHTALDAAPEGTNDSLCNLLGLVNTAPLRPFLSDTNFPTYGMGRAGILLEIQSKEVMFARVCHGLQIHHALIAGPTNGLVTRVAVCAGAGDGLLNEALRFQADLYVTGELRHHEALRAARHGMTVIATLHSQSERAVLRPLAKQLRAALPGLSVQISQYDRDPFMVFEANSLT